MDFFFVSGILQGNSKKNMKNFRTKKLNVKKIIKKRLTEYLQNFAKMVETFRKYLKKF